MKISLEMCVAGLLLLINTQTLLAYDGIQIKDGSHGNPVTADLLLKEPTLHQWSVHPVSPPGCPERCSCKMNDTKHINDVDCSSKGLTTIPDLPSTTVVLSLENNSISNITCDAFKHLRSLQDLSLASNNISHLLPCVFQSQSGSLLSLNISDNYIDSLDVKLFHDISQLKTLDLSINIIKYLANKTFSDLVQLVHLDLSFNFIHTIAPDAFQGLRSLRTLSLLNNRLDRVSSSFHRNVFQDLMALESLNTKANEGHLDNAISSLRNLSHLYMDLKDRSAAHTLGTGYRQLINLQVLHVSSIMYIMIREGYKLWSDCRMDTVPSNFFDNIRTEKSLELYMANCNIRDDFGNYTFNALPTLVTLDLSSNPFIDFDLKQSWMTSLINTTMTSLDLYNAKDSFQGKLIEDYWFQDLVKTNLKTLSLKDNKILDINCDHNFPTTIEKLDVSENSIALNFMYVNFIRSNFYDSKLRELHASDQRFGERAKLISQEMQDTHSFQHSSSSYADFERSSKAGRTPIHSELSDNNSKSDSNSLHFSPNEMVIPRHMDMGVSGSGNIVNAEYKCTIPDGDLDIINMCLPPYLEAIYARSAFLLDGNSFPHIRIINNTVLSRVDLSGNLIKNWLGPIENVPSLTFLNLSLNYCENVDVNFFKYMVGLETLILRDNYIGFSLAEDDDGLTFSTLTNLKVLDMSQNVIQDLSTPAFVNNTNLEVLDLSYNRFTEFQPTLSTFRNLSFLNLSLNLLPGLSEQTCQELKLLKSRKNIFTVNLLDNRLLFTCDYLPFLHLLISNSHIFFGVERLKFRFINGTKLLYKDLAHHFPALVRECLVERYFIGMLIMFFIVVGTVTICAVIYHKRWQLRYLYYIGHRRMHIGEHVVDYVPVADVFITYDQDDLRWRRFMRRTFLPGLNQRNVTYILGETDFPGGDVMAHVTGAVVGTKKTVVLLSTEIFYDHHREFELNLAIMREMDTRSLKIVPVFVEEVDLALYPREIEIFIRNQWQRCLFYSNSNEFWDDFVDAVREDN